MNRQLFGTDGVRGRANAYPMTAEVAMRLGAGEAGAPDDERDDDAEGQDQAADRILDTGKGVIVSDSESVDITDFRV